MEKSNINVKNGLIPIPDKRTKEKSAKFIILDEDDINYLESLPRSLPRLTFFRHGSGIAGCQAGIKFGKKYFYKNWKKACKNLGIDNLDLYGGTKHSTATCLGEHHTPEEIIKLTGHRTNKAFLRYLQADVAIKKRVKNTLKDIQETAQDNLQQTYNGNTSSKSSNIVKL